MTASLRRQVRSAHQAWSDRVRPGANRRGSNEARRGDDHARASRPRRRASAASPPPSSVNLTDSELRSCPSHPGCSCPPPRCSVRRPTGPGPCGRRRQRDVYAVVGVLHHLHVDAVWEPCSDSPSPGAIRRSSTRASSVARPRHVARRRGSGCSLGTRNTHRHRGFALSDRMVFAELNRAEGNRWNPSSTGVSTIGARFIGHAPDGHGQEAPRAAASGAPPHDGSRAPARRSPPWPPHPVDDVGAGRCCTPPPCRACIVE